MKRHIVIFVAVLFAAGAARADLADVVRAARGVEEEQTGLQPGFRFAIPLESQPFWSSATFDGSLWGTSLVDFDDDGYPEVVSVYEAGRVYIFKNSAGYIESLPGWESNDIAYNIAPAFGDVDNDGDQDMAIACYSFVGGRTKVYENRFGIPARDPVWVATSGGGTTCDWGDYDNDGDLDLAIADMFAAPAVFRNDTGVLSPSPLWTASDGNLDFGVAWVDVDLDGDLDLAVGAINASLPALRVYRNDGGTLERAASWRSTVNAGEYVGAWICAQDIDRDNDLDVAVSCGFISNNRNIVFRNSGSGLEGYPAWQSSGATMSGFSVFADLNGDGLLDWAVNDGDAGAVYENTDTVLAPTRAWSSNPGGGLGLDVGDVDADGVVPGVDTISADGRKLYYLSTRPLIAVDSVLVGGSPLPLDAWCANFKRGWVSLRDSVAPGTEILLYFRHSVDLELVMSETSTNRAHLFLNAQTGLAEGPGARTAARLRVAPNPFRDRVTVTGRTGVRGFEVRDVSGRVVRRLESSGGSATWDGRDARGNPLPAGVYLFGAGGAARAVKLD
jgi:hypothetical protein